MKRTYAKLIIKVAFGNAVKPLCGADIIKITNQQSGVVYPALRRLEAEGLLSSFKENVDPKAVGRPSRTLFKQTEAGKMDLDEELESLGLSLKLSRQMQLF